MNKFVKFLLWIWQFPQNIVGLIMSLIWREKVYKDVQMNGYADEGVKYYMYPYNSVSLGDYRFIRYNSNELTYRHENGHSVQSRYLGPLYLLTVGICSCLLNLIYRTGRIKRSYYSFWQEKWADKLAGIKKDERIY